MWDIVFPKDVLAISYHIVSDDDLPHLKYYHYKTPAQFEADIAYAVKRLRPVSYAQIRCALGSRGRRCRRAPPFLLSTTDSPSATT